MSVYILKPGFSSPSIFATGSKIEWQPVQPQHSTFRRKFSNGDNIIANRTGFAAHTKRWICYWIVWWWRARRRRRRKQQHDTSTIGGATKTTTQFTATKSTAITASANSSNNSQPNTQCYATANHTHECIFKCSYSTNTEYTESKQYRPKCALWRLQSAV